MALRYFLPVALVFCISCGSEAEMQTSDSSFNDSVANATQYMDSMMATTVADDTVHHTALPPVFDGDIIMENYGASQCQTWHELMGGKYNHVGIIFQRPKDGLLCVADVTDSVRVTELTTYVDRAQEGHIALLRLKNANLTLTEDKVKSLRQSAKNYKGVPADLVLNWDDSHLYPAEFVWKVYNNAMRLTLCPTRKVEDFDISEEKKKELGKQYGGQVSARDEAVSIDDIYHSEKLEIVFEK
jgi:hypothetical protein